MSSWYKLLVLVLLRLFRPGIASPPVLIGLLLPAPHHTRTVGQLSFVSKQQRAGLFEEGNFFIIFSCLFQVSKAALLAQNP